jgi:hypothetical protein
VSNREGHQRLVAYIVAKDTKGVLPVRSLRNLVKERLPEYFMPNLFVTLEKLPVTDNLKVDRKKLPPIVPSRVAVADYEEPVSATEKKVADIWGKILGIAQISRNDHFFELGGDSLLR